MKKILAVLLALAMLLGFAACGGNNEDTTTTTAEDTTVAEEVTEDAAGAEETTAAAEEDATVAEEATTVAEETTVAAETTAAAEEETTVAAETTKAADTTAAPVAPAGDMTKADFVKFINAETAKIAKSGSYALTRDCSYVKPIDVGGATDILNSIISAIDENSNLDTVVGDFLGIGITKGNVPKDDIKGDYKIKATTLTEADLGSFAANNGTYTFTLANATDPKKTGATPFSRFTNDFITHEEVVDGIAGFTTAIKVNKTTVNYKNIKVTVKVADGKITDISYSYDFDAQLALKAVVTINGTGAAKTKGTYANIKY